MGGRKSEDPKILGCTEHKIVHMVHNSLKETEKTDRLPGTVYFIWLRSTSLESCAVYYLYS
jgi:hypothetical protein